MFDRAYLEITDVCNLSCAFCPGTARPPQFITLPAFSCLSEKLRSCTDYLYLHVLGEPLLHPELADILRRCRQLDFRVCVTTNGTLLAEKLPVLLSSPALHKVSISLHSFEGNGRDAGLAAYLSQCWDACTALAEQGVLCTLRLWNGGGADALNGAICRWLSGVLGQDVTALPTDRKGNRRLREHIYLEPGEKFDWPHPDAPERGTQFCYGLRRQIAVLCDGTVVPCCLDGEGRMALGNLLEQDLADILSSPRAKAIADGFARRRPAEALCRRCGYALRFNR